MSAATDMQTFQFSEPPEATGLAFAAGFFFASRIMVVLISVRVLGTEPHTGSEMNLALGLLLLILVCFQSLGHVRRTLRSMLRLSSIRWVLAFLAFSLCSLSWSATVSLSTSLAYWCGLAVDVTIVFLLLRAGAFSEVSLSLLKGFVSGTCFLALVAWIIPTRADLRLGDEDYFNTNQIGNLCAVAIFLAQYLMRRKAGRWGITILFLALTLVRSLSKTTLVAFLLSEGFLIIRDQSISKQAKVLLSISVILVILVFWGLFAAYYDIYTNAGNQAETLTGRTGIWAFVLNAALEQPWIGHGFDAMWKVIPPFGPDRFEARHAENELLTQFYAYGVVGVCLLVCIYGSLYRQIRKLSASPIKIVLLSTLLFVVIRGLAEADPFDLLLPLWSIVLFSLLIEQAKASDDRVAMGLLAGKWNADRTPQSLPIME